MAKQAKIDPVQCHPNHEPKFNGHINSYVCVKCGAVQSGFDPNVWYKFVNGVSEELPNNK